LSCGSATKGKTYNIPLVSAVVANPFYLTMRNGAELVAKEFDQKCGVTINVTYQGATDFTAASEMPVLSALESKPVDALLVVPGDLVGNNGPLKTFHAKGAPIITLDTTSSDKSILSSAITSDGYGGGEQAARLIAQFAHEKGTVAVNSIAAGVTTTDARVAGFLAGMKKYAPNMKILGTQYNNFSIASAQSETAAQLLSNPGMVAVFGANETAGEGAGAAVDAAGKKGKVMVLAFDADTPEVPLLKNGTISALIVQRPGFEGQLGMQYAFDLLTGQESKVQKNVVLANVVATTKNASSPDVAKYYYTSTNTD
jgi:ribose transport system substrate-binding protein